MKAKLLRKLRKQYRLIYLPGPDEYILISPHGERTLFGKKSWAINSLRDEILFEARFKYRKYGKQYKICR